MRDHRGDTGHQDGGFHEDLRRFQTKLIERPIAGQCQQPRNKWPAGTVVLLGVPPHLQKNVLHHLFGNRCLFENTQNQRKYQAGMAVIQLFKSAHVPLKKPVHERRIDRHFVRVRGLENRKEQVWLPYLPHGTT